MGGGSAKTAGDSSTDQPIFNLSSLLQGNGSAASTAGASTFNAGTSSLSPSIDYYSKLLSGDPTATASAIEPTTTGIMQQYDTAYKNITDNGARGGQRSGSVAANSTAAAGKVSDVIAGVQPAAAQGLTNTASTLAGLGVAEQGVGNQDIMSALQNLLSMRGQDINYTTEQQKNNTALGSSLGGILAKLLAA
jgi:hypothetical protein